MSEFRSPLHDPDPPSFGGDETVRTRTETVRTGAPLTGRAIPRRRFGRLRWLLRVATWSATLALATVLGLIVLYRFVDPPTTTLIIGQRLAGIAIDRRPVAIGRISPNLLRAVIASEDGQFCRHRGIDWRELGAAIDAAQDGGARGGSTISMQVIKNLFLWPSKSYLRKALEIPLTLVMEALWPKRRVLEVYLNIAEWGPGVFGAEAAAEHHFRKPSGRITEHEATLLAVALPNPFTRVAGKPSANLQRVAAVIERRVKVMGSRADCVLGTAARSPPAAGLRQERPMAGRWLAAAAN